VDQDAYLLALARYIVLNPVRAHLVESAGETEWSSYKAVMGKMRAPEWLAVDDTLSMFHQQRGPARRAYARFVRDGIGASDPHEDMQRAGVLGGQAFMDRILDYVDSQALSPEIVRKDRPAPSLDVISERNQERDVAIQKAYSTGAYTLTEIAEFFGMHRSTASRIAQR